MANTNLIPETPASFPRQGNLLTRAAGKFFLRLAGWRVTGSFPDINRMIFAIAPHTSNWDFFIGLAGMLAVGLRAHWLGKHSIFVWPVSPVLRSLGGIPIVRHSATGTVEQVAARFEAETPFILAIAPEGTRKRVGKLKTGFIRIAIAADVPVFLIALNYRLREINLGELYHPTGDLVRDEQFVRNYFRQFQGKYPDQYSP